MKFDYCVQKDDKNKAENDFDITEANAYQLVIGHILQTAFVL